MSDSHKQKVSSAAGKWGRMQKDTFAPQQVLNENYLAWRQQRNGQGVVESTYPVLHGGKWLQANGRDDLMDIKQKLLTGKDGKINPSAATPFGVMTVQDGDIKWLQKKKDQEEYVRQLDFASYLIDDQRPETQQKAFDLFPELKAYPDQSHRESVLIQETLRNLLKTGQIKGKDDLQLVMYITQDEFQLPWHPVWDDQGLIIAAVYGKDAETDSKARAAQYLKLMENWYRIGLFNPNSFANGKNTPEAFRKIQRQLKKMILRRLYPGLRDKPDSYLDHEIDKYSAITGRLIDNSYMNLYNWFTDPNSKRGDEAVAPPARSAPSAPVNNNNNNNTRVPPKVETFNTGFNIIGGGGGGGGASLLDQLNSLKK